RPARVDKKLQAPQECGYPVVRQLPQELNVRRQTQARRLSLEGSALRTVSGDPEGERVPGPLGGGRIEESQRLQQQIQPVGPIQRAGRAENDTRAAGAAR